MSRQPFAPPRRPAPRTAHPAPPPTQEPAYPPHFPETAPDPDAREFIGEPPPPPSPEMETVQRQHMISFIQGGMNAALGLRTQVHHFQVRGVGIPADAREQLAALFRDLADSIDAQY